MHDDAESGAGAASCSLPVCGGKSVLRFGQGKRKAAGMFSSGTNRSMEIKNSCKGEQMFCNRTYSTILKLRVEIGIERNYVF